MQLEHITNILTAWPLGSIHACKHANGGTINQIWLIDSDAGRFALRCYRRREPTRALYEHRVTAFVRSRGLPAIAPLPLANGTTLLEHDDRLYALFPFAPGRQYHDDELDEHLIRAMGSFLAQLHLALADYPHDQIRRIDWSLDRQHSLAAVRRYLTLIDQLPTRRASDDAAHERLLGQQDWIEGQSESALDELFTLEQQAIHGDYTHNNLFFADGRVSAVIDWDQGYLAPRAWEVVRVLDLVLHFAPAQTQYFITSYRQIAPVSMHELDLAVRCYGSMRGHDTWMYEAIYNQGNDRVRDFIRPGGFLPIETQWNAARAALPMD